MSVTSVMSHLGKAQSISLSCRVPEHCDSRAMCKMDCSRGVAALHAGPPCAELPGALQVSICTQYSFL